VGTRVAETSRAYLLRRLAREALFLIGVEKRSWSVTFLTVGRVGVGRGRRETSRRRAGDLLMSRRKVNECVQYGPT